MKTVTASIQAFLLLIMATSAVGQVPTTISFQGYLTDSLGAPITDIVNFDLALHTASAGGKLVWSESQNANVKDGVYDLDIGRITPLDPAYFVAQLFLEIKVESEIIGDRIALDSVPYAYEAHLAKGVRNLCSSGDFINCYSGPGGTMGVGECKAGMRLCNSIQTGFDSCTDETIPTSEICDALDNNCDGVVDEFPCCIQDDNERNDTFATANIASDVTCGNGNAVSGTFESGSDNDWFTFNASDSFSCSVVPAFSFGKLVAGVCAYFECNVGTASVGCLDGSSSNTANGLDGCCSTASFSVSLNCTGSLDDDAAVWMKVLPAPSAECSDYTVSYSY